MKFPWAMLVKLIVFAICSLFVLNIMWNTLNNATDGDTLTYTAHFADASGLHEGDSVRVAGVVVGTVEEVALGDENDAVVRFRVQDDHQLSTNTQVLIRYENLIGQRYLALRPGEGKGEPLPDESDVPMGHTEGALDLSVLMNGFDPLFDILSPKDVNRLADTLVKVFQGEGATLTDLLDQIGAVSGDLAQHDDVIGRVITNLGEVVTHLASKDEEFGDLVGQTRALMVGLAKDRHVIGDSLEGMGTLATAMSDLLVRIRPGLRADREKAARVFGIYARDRKLVGDVIAATSDFFERAGGLAHYGSWFNTYVCEVRLAPVVNLTPLTQLLLGNQHSEVCR